jgi:hypothetical protein
MTFSVPRLGNSGILSKMHVMPCLEDRNKEPLFNSAGGLRLRLPDALYQSEVLGESVGIKWKAAPPLAS